MALTNDKPVYEASEEHWEMVRAFMNSRYSTSVGVKDPIIIEYKEVRGDARRHQTIYVLNHVQYIGFREFFSIPYIHPEDASLDSAAL